MVPVTFCGGGPGGGGSGAALAALGGGPGGGGRGAAIPAAAEINQPVMTSRDRKLTQAKLTMAIAAVLPERMPATQYEWL
eukprot:scaffold152110_cov16-Prasinocladus_malaysianus.AAC.1